jgi:endonuclease/exonuclease/phosphatase family metal-dependent hydrolase
MLLLVTWNCDGKVNESFVAQIVTACEQEAEKREIKIEGRIICIQETSRPGGKGDDDEHKIATKLGRISYEGVGTNKEDSGNQRCNTIVLWEKGKFTREGRSSKFKHNRYYECVSLKYSSHTFWVMSVHGPSGGPGNYANNGSELGGDLDDDVLEHYPLIAAGDMNCEPGNMVLNAKKRNPGSVVRPGKPTRIKSQRELDFMIAYGSHAEFLTVACAGNVSDHCGVGFLVQPWS